MPALTLVPSPHNSPSLSSQAMPCDPYYLVIPTQSDFRPKVAIIEKLYQAEWVLFPRVKIAAVGKCAMTTISAAPRPQLKQILPFPFPLTLPSLINNPHPIPSLPKTLSSHPLHNHLFHITITQSTYIANTTPNQNSFSNKKPLIPSSPSRNRSR